MSQKPKIIALVEWDFQGHRLTWFVLHALACIEIGMGVILICQNPILVKKYLQTFDIDFKNQKKLHIIGFDFYSSPREIIRNLLPSYLTKPLVSIIRGLKFNNAIRRIEKKICSKIDFIFFSCLVEHEIDVFQPIIKFSQINWSGLNLQIQYTKTGKKNQETFSLEKVFYSAKNKSIAVIDESVIDKIKLKSNKPVIHFPEFTDERYLGSTPAVEKLKKFAGEAKIVLAIGHFRPNKGIIDLIEVASEINDNKIVFAFIGEIPWSMYEERSKRLLTTFIKHNTNAFFYSEFVPASEYNDFILSSNIIFAAYHDFPHSSNTLTKAALFQRPIIVSDTGVMGVRVSEYQMGLVIPQKNKIALKSAILELTHNYESWLSINKPRWDEYGKKNSFNSLKSSFIQVFS